MSLEVRRWSESAEPDARMLRKRLQSEGYSVSEWCDAPGTVYPVHSHEEDQTHWIISGALEFNVAGEVYTLRAGDRDFLPANTPHAARVANSEPVCYLIGAKNH